MATNKWLGTALPVAQVTTLTVGGTIEAGDKFKVTIGTKTISVTASTTVVLTTCQDILTALSATLHKEFSELSFSATATTVSLTSKIKGKAFTASVTTTESDDSPADSQTFSAAVTTANEGPNDWSTAANWSLAAAPVNSDDVIIENLSTDILYGLDQTGVTLTSLTINPTYTGKIGLPNWNAEGGYYEYRTAFLSIKATTQTIEATGSQRIKIDNSTAQTTLTIRGTNQTTEAGIPAMLWKGTHASNVVNVFRGDVGVAFQAGETAVVATLNVGWITNPGGDARVQCGSGVTLTTINQNGGDLTIKSAATTITKTDGVLRCFGGAITTLNERGGITYYNSTGTITTLSVAAGGTFTTEQDSRARTITNSTGTAKGALLDPSKSITFTNPLLVSGCGLYPKDPDGFVLDLGQNFSIQRS